MTLYKVSILVTDTASKFSIFKFEAKEASKTFVTSSHRIKKEDILKPQTIYNNNATLQVWYLFCKEEDIEEAKNIIYQKVTDELVQMQKNLQCTFSNLINHVAWEIRED